MQEAPKPLLCKWYAYTGCKETFDATEVKAWKDHVLEHFVNTKNFKYAVGREVTCWVRGCSEALQVGPEPMAHDTTFSQMMEHVRVTHMSPPSSIDWKDLRNDDVSLIYHFWRSVILPAAAEGSISSGTISYWSQSYNLPVVRRVVRADTGDRREMTEVSDKSMRDERREARYHVSERTKGKGKDIDTEGESSGSAGDKGST